MGAGVRDPRDAPRRTRRPVRNSGRRATSPCGGLTTETHAPETAVSGPVRQVAHGARRSAKMLRRVWPPDPPTRLHPGPLGQRRAWPDRLRGLRPSHHRIGRLVASPDALHPHQGHRSTARRQVPHPRETPAMQPGLHTAAAAELNCGRGFDRLLQLAVVLRHREQDKPANPSIAVAALTSSCTWGLPRLVSLTPRIVRPQARLQAQAEARVSTASPRFTAKSPLRPSMYLSRAASRRRRRSLRRSRARSTCSAEAPGNLLDVDVPRKMRRTPHVPTVSPSASSTQASRASPRRF